MFFLIFTFIRTVDRKLCMTYNKIGKIGVVSGVVSTNRPRGGENPLTTGVKKALPYRTDREAWYLPVSTE